MLRQAEHPHGEMMEMMEQDSNPGSPAAWPGFLLHAAQPAGGPPAGARGGNLACYGLRVPAITHINGSPPQRPLPDRRWEQLLCPEHAKGRKSGGSACDTDPVLPRQPRTAVSDTGQTQEEAGGRGGPC